MAMPEGFSDRAAAGENDAAAVSGGGGAGEGGGGAATGCRRGRKAIVPWRFQIGFRRTWTPCNGSHGPPRTDQCAPAASARNQSPVRVVSAATTRRSTLKKVQIGAAASVQRKKKMNKDVDSHQAMPKSRFTTISRETFLASLQEFRVVFRKLLEEERSKCRKHEQDIPADDDAAFQVFRERLCVQGYDDDRRYQGDVPGVEVGDVFDSDAELCFVGLHRSRGSCVDYVSRNGSRTSVAVSIVSSYPPNSARDDHNLEVLLHVGPVAPIEELAMKQSMDRKEHVRVIYRFVVDHQGGSEQLMYYVYGGLYLVEKFLKEEAREEKHILTFQLRRMTEQRHIDIEDLARNRMAEPSNGTFILDISAGLEKIHVSAINSMSNEYPMPFRYMSGMQYHPNYQLDPPSGCDCVGRCSDSHECACAVKNGGEIPFNDNGYIIEEKPLIYECGPSCKCPPTCHNRVSQHGIKFRLQVFKTESMGWGVRSLDFIPSGSFVCEYVGEVLDNKDAQERENDEYFFGIGDNYYKIPRWEGLLKTIPSLRNGPEEDVASVFTVDALKWGNVARFINHSCTPNLFPQNILYDHDDMSMPHIGLFSSDDIPPLQPLSYDYNYTIDGVCDSQGNIKKKQCFCGSSECNVWLY